MTWLRWILVALVWAQWTPLGHAAAQFRAASSAGVYQGTGVYAASSAASTAASGSITPTVVAERNALLICVVEQHDNVAISFPAGWTQLYSLSSTSNHRASVFYKVSANTESNPTITHAGGNAIIARCFRVRGVDGQNLQDVAYAAQYAANSNLIKSGTMTTLTANDLMVFVPHVAAAPSVSVPPGTSGGFSLTSRFFSTTTLGADAAVGLYTGTLATPGPVGPVSETVSLASENHGVLMALHGGSTLSIPQPVGTLANDVMVAAITAVPASATINPPSGWTIIASKTGSKGKLSTYFRVATASEPNFYTWSISSTHTGAVGGITSFSGVSVANPIEASAVQTTASSVSHTAPSVTTATGNDILLTVHTFASSPYSTNNSYNGAWAPPTGMQEAIDDRSRGIATGNGVALEMNYLALASGGATGSYTATSSASNAQKDVGITAAIALRSTNSIDHLEIDYPQSTLSSCAATPVTVYACASSGNSCATLYTGGLNGIVLTPGGGTINIPAGSAAVTATVSQSAGAGTLAASSVAPYATTCKNLSTSSFGCGVNFAATVLTLPTTNFVSGKTIATTATACTVPNGANLVSFYSSYNDPSSGTASVSVAPQVSGNCGVFTPVATSASSPTPVSLIFTSNVAPLCITYPDVGKVKLVSTVGSASATSFFTAVPDHFTIESVSCVSGCKGGSYPGAVDATGTAFMKAGTPLSVTVTAYNGASTSAITPNFGKESTPATVSLTPASNMSDLGAAVTGTFSCSSPSGTCVNNIGGSVVLGGFGASVPGKATNTFLYSEVGNMTLTANLNDPSSVGYMALGSTSLNPTATTSGSIGRFIPDHFTVIKDAVSPVLTQSDFLPKTTAAATGTTAPTNTIDIDDSTGFVVGAKIRVTGGGSGGNAFTAKITSLAATTLTLDSSISTDLVSGDTVLQEWGNYMGEPFVAQFSLIAQDANNNQTQNYRGAYAMLDPLASGNPLGFAAVSGATNLTSRLVVGSGTSGVFGSSGASVSAPLSISKPNSGVDGPYTALVIGVAPVDSDGVAMGSFDMSVGGATDHTSIMDPAVQASTELRFGRTRVSNAYGSELLSLAVPVSIQYWNGSAFVTAAEDAATLLNASNVVLSAPLGALTVATGASASNTCVPPPLPISITLTNGAGKFCLAKPGTRGNINLSISAPSYLPSNSAVANFGVYKSPLIYRRENY